MNAAVLCPGPSVQRYPINGDLRLGELSPTVPRAYDVVVGVNRAATLYPCDFWCLLDHYTYALRPVIGKPTICCHAAIYNNMCAAYPEAKTHGHVALENIPLPFDKVVWRTWSATTAVVVAHLQGADVIDCYGMDWVGSSDWDGFTHEKHRRTSKRWASERKLMQQIQDWLATLGCTVRRVGVT